MTVTGVWYEKRLALDSFRDGLLDVEDLCNYGLLTFAEAATLVGQPARGVAWLLGLAARDFEERSLWKVD